jgi:SAM-dependent methyltransferase
MKSKLDVNIASYRSDEAVEKYSNYGLYPNEKLLFGKYFRKNSSILDLACGAGRTTLRLHELGYQVKGSDLSDPLIELARKRFPQISFTVDSFTDIHEESSSFDNVLISHNGLDYAYPEEQRLKAISECARVLRDDGILIISSHNIKSLHFSPYYLKESKWWMLKNMLKAFYSRAYIRNLGMWTFFCSPAYCIRQVESFGFRLEEMMGFRSSTNHFFNTYLSPYNHYVFRKLPKS